MTEGARRASDEVECQEERKFNLSSESASRSNLQPPMSPRNKGSAYLFHPVTGVILTITAAVASASVSRSIAALLDWLAVVLWPRHGGKAGEFETDGGINLVSNDFVEAAVHFIRSHCKDGSVECRRRIRARLWTGRIGEDARCEGNEDQSNRKSEAAMLG